MSITVGTVSIMEPAVLNAVPDLGGYGGNLPPISRDTESKESTECEYGARGSVGISPPFWWDGGGELAPGGNGMSLYAALACAGTYMYM